MTARQANRSAAIPVLVCGIAGGLLGGLNCCCWLAPLLSSFFCVRWVRGGAADEASAGVSSAPRPGGAGVMASLVSALLIATFGTAVFLFLNDPERASESRAAIEGLFGAGDMGEVPISGLALGLSVFGFVSGLCAGLVGTALGSMGGRRTRTSPNVAPPASRSATRFLDGAAAVDGPGAAVAGPSEQVPVGATEVGSPADAGQDAPPPAPPAVPAAEAVPAEHPVAVAPASVAPVAAPPEPEEAAGPAQPDWSRFRRPAPQATQDEGPATRDGEASAWEEEE